MKSLLSGLQHCIRAWTFLVQIEICLPQTSHNAFLITRNRNLVPPTSHICTGASCRNQLTSQDTLKVRRHFLTLQNRLGVELWVPDSGMKILPSPAILKEDSGVQPSRTQSPVHYWYQYLISAPLLFRGRPFGSVWHKSSWG